MKKNNHIITVLVSALKEKIQGETKAYNRRWNLRLAGSGMAILKKLHLG